MTSSPPYPEEGGENNGLGEGNGASLSATGLSSATPIEPVPVSPLRASIPSAWLDPEDAPRDSTAFIGRNKDNLIGVVGMAEYPARTTTKTTTSGPFWNRTVVTEVTRTGVKDWSLCLPAPDGRSYEWQLERFELVGWQPLSRLHELPASRIEARSDETPSAAQPEGQEPDPEGDAQPAREASL